MSALTPASEVILRHSDEFIARHVLFAGDLQDALPAQFDAAGVRVHSNQYHHWQLLSTTLEENVQFGLLATPEIVATCDTLVYYWPKSKQEAQFQLANLLSLLPVGTDIFVVGENRSGVRSAEEMLSDFAQLTKIDSARRCGLYHGRLDKQPEFDADAWWESYQVGDVTVKTLRVCSAAIRWIQAAICCCPPSASRLKAACWMSVVVRAYWPRFWRNNRQKSNGP